ncbi:Presenilin-domain-containing protein, partial [Fimicolochytrium jonesii]|uniref:Presenilin-domain-containing protein n=1 Tax=Fimicolochytrium jonesii TaxID=1396493 RepID=UPI0022FEB068
LSSELLSVHNLPLDQITFWFFIWNLTIVGVLMIFGRGPLRVQQGYLVGISSMMAYTLTKIPALTTWILLGLLAIWDLIAVLCPFGPLRILVETAQTQDREIPALLYSVMVWMTMAGPGVPPSLRVSPAEPREVEEEDEDEEAVRGGLKLGLGDFVFYSVLVARAALFDPLTTLTSTLAVLTGLNMTIFLLALYQKALPALPISIAFGILFYFVSAVTLVGFVGGLLRVGARVRAEGQDGWLWVGRGGGGGMVFV